MYRERRPLIATHDFGRKTSSKKRKRWVPDVVRDIVCNAAESGLRVSVARDRDADVKTTVVGIVADMRLARRPEDSGSGAAFTRTRSEALVKLTRDENNDAGFGVCMTRLTVVAVPGDSLEAEWANVHVGQLYRLIQCRRFRFARGVRAFYRAC